MHYGPHEKSVMHEHPAGVVVTVTAGHLKFIDQNGHVQEKVAELGEARWFPAQRHRVENLGDTPYNAVYIGIKSAARQTAANGQPPELDAETQAIVSALIASAKK